MKFLQSSYDVCGAKKWSELLYLQLHVMIPIQMNCVALFLTFTVALKVVSYSSCAKEQHIQKWPDSAHRWAIYGPFKLITVNLEWEGHVH